MGPGLFFLLTFTALAARAERAVGLEAQGVDPLSALHNPGGLDVRDGLGRPVSARLIEAQLKQAQGEAASHAAYASALPQAAAIAAILDMLQALRLALRGGAASQTPQRIFAVVLKLRSIERSSPVLIAVLLAAFVVLGRFARDADSSAYPASCRPQVLRC